MNFVELTKFLVASVIPDITDVSIKQFEVDGIINIEILTNDDLIKHIIGKKGSTINAIRTLVQASSYVNGNQKININVSSYNSVL